MTPAHHTALTVALRGHHRSIISMFSHAYSLAHHVTMGLILQVFMLPNDTVLGSTTLAKILHLGHSRIPVRTQALLPTLATESPPVLNHGSLHVLIQPTLVTKSAPCCCVQTVGK